MDQIPPFSASLGAMGSLTRKLDALQDTELKYEVGELRSRLLKLSKARDPPAAVRIWMNDARELSYVMDNCVDAEADWVEKMSEFKTRVKDANSRYDWYIPQTQSVPSSTDIFPIVDLRLPPPEDSGPNPDPVVGLHAVGGAVDTLCQWLTDEEKELKVICIVGAGGIGKTTLAKQLWRDKKLEVASTMGAGGIECRAFVRTSKKPDMRRILRSILAQVRPHQPPDANEVQELIQELTQHLKDKRYFLIIDDLWATSVWDLARRAFPKGGKGSRIVTTTENDDIAIACCGYESKYIFQMDPLSDSQSKELFTRALFGSGKDTSGQMDEVSDAIVRRCAGLPQAIISISNVLASQREAKTVHSREKIQNKLAENSTSDDEILKQVLNFCFNCLPSCLQTCLLYLSLYPENYMILKEDIVRQWVAEGFILAPTDNEKVKIAGRYFDKLVDMGLIQQIDVSYSDEVLYYAVHHTVHDLITSKSMEENFVTVVDYSQRKVRFTNKISRLSLQFGSATNAAIPASTGLSQVRSLAFIGLVSCLPSLFDFNLLRFLRFLILHIWADQPSKGVDLKRTTELVLLRSLQVTCNGTVHLPDLLQGPKQLETLDINARVADIPANIVHLRSWLHLRLGVGTELPDVTGFLKNATLNSPISLDESSSPPNSVTTIQLLRPICRIPKWIGQLSNLCILKLVVREMQMDDINNLQTLPLTFLSLHVQRPTTGLISFAAGSFDALESFEFRCGVLRLMFQKGSMPNLQRLMLHFNAHRELDGRSLLGIQDLSNVQEISALIGVATDAEKDDFEAAESAFNEIFRNHPSIISVKRGDMVDEDGLAQNQHAFRAKDGSSKRPAIPKQEYEEDIKQNTGSASQINQRRNTSPDDQTEKKSEPSRTSALAALHSWAWRPRWAVPQEEVVVLAQAPVLATPAVMPSAKAAVSAPVEDAELAVNTADLIHLHRMVEEKDGGPAWIHMMDRSMPTFRYQAWQRDVENGPTQYRCSTIFEDASPDVVRDFFWDDEFRMKNTWDNMLLEHDTLEEYTETGTMVVRWVRKFPFFISSREYIIGRRIWACGNTYYCVTKSVHHPSVPRSSKPRRVDLYYSSWCIRPVESRNGDGAMTACEMLLFHHEDMGIPWDVAKAAVRLGMWGGVKRIEPGLRAYQAARAAGKPMLKHAAIAHADTKFFADELNSEAGSSSGNNAVAERPKHWNRNLHKVFLISAVVALAFSFSAGDRRY